MYVDIISGNFIFEEILINYEKKKTVSLHKRSYSLIILTKQNPHQKKQ